MQQTWKLWYETLFEVLGFRQLRRLDAPLGGLFLQLHEDPADEAGARDEQDDDEFDEGRVVEHGPILRGQREARNQAGVKADAEYVFALPCDGASNPDARKGEQGEGYFDAGADA